MSVSANKFDLATPAINLVASLVPWDSEVFGFPVAQIHTLEIADHDPALQDYEKFREWLDVQQIRVAACRLLHNRLQESMFLEEQGFRFIEMVLHPHLANITSLNIAEDSLTILPAQECDLPALQAIAEHAFSYERYHVDPRFDPRLGDLRYSYWVRNSLQHPRQRLLKIQDGERLVAFFVVETRADKSVYWHLTAIATEWQGQGYGRRVWRAMLRHHCQEGFNSLTTTIAVRNILVLNLYARLGFRFLPPEMTFHWLRECNHG